MGPRRHSNAASAIALSQRRTFPAAFDQAALTMFGMVAMLSRRAHQLKMPRLDAYHRRPGPGE
jgi:hypothetical protein